jgi:hypothetical protein
MKKVPCFTYGVDTSKPVTPLLVRDAILECFFKAHCEDSGVTSEEAEARKYCRQIVEKVFSDNGDDFEKPTKQSLINCVEGLVSFSKYFRNPQVIEKHYDEIMELINMLP